MELRKLENKNIDIKLFFKQNWVLFVAIIYILFPVDFIPDIIPVLGLSDDIFVLLGSLLLKYAKFKKGDK